MENGTFEGLVDPRLEDNYDKQQMASMVACAAFSVRHSAKRRPRMSQVINILLYYHKHVVIISYYIN